MEKLELRRRRRRGVEDRLRLFTGAGAQPKYRSIIKIVKKARFILKRPSFSIFLEYFILDDSGGRCNKKKGPMAPFLFVTCWFC